MERKQYHGFRSWWVGGWVWPIFTTVATLVWIGLIYLLIGIRSPGWQYGTTPYVPGSSPFAIENIPRGPVPAQVKLPSGPQRGTVR